jgi:hypothetical protein
MRYVTRSKKEASNPLEAVISYGLDALERGVYRVVSKVVKPRKQR